MRTFSPANYYAYSFVLISLLARSSDVNGIRIYNTETYNSRRSSLIGRILSLADRTSSYKANEDDTLRNTSSSAHMESISERTPKPAPARGVIDSPLAPLVVSSSSTASTEILDNNNATNSSNHSESKISAQNFSAASDLLGSSKPDSSTDDASSNTTSSPSGNATSPNSSEYIDASSIHSTGSTKHSNNTLQDANTTLQDDNSTDDGTGVPSEWSYANRTDDTYNLNSTNNSSSLLPAEPQQPRRWPAIVAGLFVGVAVLLCGMTAWNRQRQTKRRQYQRVNELVV
jgi:hypothetical protein